MMHKKFKLLVVLLTFFVIYTAPLKRVIHGFQGNLVQISVPKSGTHLLWKLICELTGRTMKYWKPGETIDDWGKLSHVSLQDANVLSSLGSKYLWLTHTLYSDELYNVVQKNNCKKIFLYRDPRDQLVSSAYFLKKRNPKLLSSISISNLITRLIFEGPPLPDKNILPGIANMYYSRMPWNNCPEVFSIRFEDLVSSNNAIQFMTLKNLANYLEVSIDDEALHSIVSSVFGKGATFRKGSTGEWKTHLTPEQKTLVKQEAGQLLIELGYENDYEW